MTLSAHFKFEGSSMSYLYAEVEEFTQASVSGLYRERGNTVKFGRPHNTMAENSLKRTLPTHLSNGLQFTARTGNISFPNTNSLMPGPPLLAVSVFFLLALKLP